MWDDYYTERKYERKAYPESIREGFRKRFPQKNRETVKLGW